MDLSKAAYALPPLWHVENERQRLNSRSSAVKDWGNVFAAADFPSLRDEEAAAENSDDYDDMLEAREGAN